MSWKSGHMVLLVLGAFLMMGCTRETVPSLEGPGITLTVRCDDAVPTKADPQLKDGETSFNENLIQSVDFLFYPGADPDAGTDAVYHIRKELEAGPVQASLKEATFHLKVKKDIIHQIFTEANGFRATVYTLVNFDASFVEDLSLTSRTDLAARRILTDFSRTETDYVQPSFLMDGMAVLDYHENAAPNVDGTINVSRFAAKLTVAVNVAGEVQLKHLENDW